MKISSAAISFANRHRRREANAIPEESGTLSISAGRAGAFLFTCITVLVALSLLGQVLRLSFGREYVFGFVPKFNLDEENNIPSLFSALLLIAVGALSFVIGKLKSSAANQFRVHWFVLALLFVALGFDEATSIHETLIDPLRAAFKTGGIFHYAWVLAAIPAVVIFLAAFAKFFFHLPTSYRRLIGTALFIYISGALGMELVGGWWAETHGLANWGYVACTTIEETLEMAGVSMLIIGLIRYLAEFTPEIRWRVQA